MRSKRLRKIVAVICTVTLLPIGAFSSHVKDVKGAEQFEGLTPLTLSDADIDDGSGPAFGGFNVENLDGVLFSANLKYIDEYAQLHYGTVSDEGDESYGGISFWLEGADIVVGNVVEGMEGAGFLHNMPFELIRLNAELAGVGETFANTEFLLQVTTEFVELDSDGEKNDIKLGVFVKGNLYNNQYLYIKDNASQLGTRVNSTYDGIISYTSYAKTTVKVEQLEGLTPLTLSDAGIDDGMGAAFGGFNVENLDGVLFSANLKYIDEYAQLHYGTVSDVGDESYGGISFWLEGTDIVVGNVVEGMEGAGFLHNMPFELIRLNAELAGVGETFANTEFLLQVTTEFVELDSDGDENDIKLGVFVNGNLYNSEYLYIKDNASQLGTRVNSTYDGIISYTSYGKTPAEIEHSELGASDFDLDDKIIKNGSHLAQYDNELFMDTAVEMMIQFPKKAGSTLYFGGENHGLCLTTVGSGKIQVSYVNEQQQSQDVITLNAKTADVASFEQAEQRWRFTFLIQNAESQNNVTIGIYINGQLYNSQFIYLEDVNLDCFKRIIGIHAVNGAFAFSTNKYEELTLNDFNMKDKYITDAQQLPYVAFNFCDREFLDGTAFSTYVTYGEGMNRFTLGTPDGAWDGVHFMADGSGEIALVYINRQEDTQFFGQLNAEKAGLDTLVGEELKIRATFDFLKGETDELQLRVGVWLNDTFYDYFTVDNVDTGSLYRTVWLYEDSVPFSIRSIEKPVDLLIYGF